MAIRLPGAFRRIAGAALIGAAFFTAVAGARLVLDGRRHLGEARLMLGSGDRAGAIAAFEDAAKSFFPGSPYPARAHRELSILAKAAEIRGETEESIYIWRVVHRSILATRNFYQPNKSRMLEAKSEIERLIESQSSDYDAAPKNPGVQVRPSNETQRNDDPDPFISMAIFLGLATWFCGSIALCAAPRRHDREGDRFRKWAWASCLGGLALWLAMVWLAG